MIINLHHHSEDLKKAIFQYDFQARIHFIHEKTILNTAGGIANALRRLDVRNREMVVVHGDILCDIDMAPT